MANCTEGGKACSTRIAGMRGTTQVSSDIFFKDMDLKTQRTRSVRDHCNGSNNSACPELGELMNSPALEAAPSGKHCCRSGSSEHP